MKKLALLVLLAISISGFAKGLSDGAKDAPKSMLSPCVVKIGRDTFMNANNFTTARIDPSNERAIQYRFGYQYTEITYADNASAIQGLKDTMAKIEAKCN
jgi:hypothetical protein